MRITRLVHKREPHNIYIGRPSIWGNPWSHKENTLAEFKVTTRQEAVQAYEDWLRGKLKPLGAEMQFVRDKILNKLQHPRRSNISLLVRSRPMSWRYPDKTSTGAM